MPVATAIERPLAEPPGSSLLRMYATFHEKSQKNESYTSGISCLKNPSLLQDAVGLLLEAEGKRTWRCWKKHPRQLFTVDLHPEVQVEMCTAGTVRDLAGILVLPKM